MMVRGGAVATGIAADFAPPVRRSLLHRMGCWRSLRRRTTLQQRDLASGAPRDISLDATMRKQVIHP